MGKKEYSNLVTNRINELQIKLNELINKRKEETNKSIIERLQLEIDIISEKIKYLKEIELLPLYISISSLSESEIYELETKKHISFSELEHKLHLDTVKSILNRNRTTTLAYLKELFIDDFDAMYNLLYLQNTNITYQNKIKALYNNGSNSIAFLNIANKKLNILETKTNDLISELENDYNFLTLKELKHYITNKSEKLPIEFILKHKEKVIRNNPEMEKIINKLTHKNKFNFITKIFKTKRNKNEQQFIESIISTYKNDTRLRTFGLSSNESLLDNSNTMKKFIKRLNRRITSKRSELTTLRNDIVSRTNETMGEIRSLETQREEKRKHFISLLQSKTSFLPKIFVEQLWNEPELKSSLIRVSNIVEEKKLISALSTELRPDVTEVLETREQTHTKKLTA